MLEIQKKAYKHCTVVFAAGRVDSDTSVALRNALDSLLESGVYNIVIDMEKLEFMSSAGFRVLLAAQQTARKHNGEIVLVNVPDLIGESLELTGFDLLFTIYDNLTDAVGRF